MLEITALILLFLIVSKDLHIYYTNYNRKRKSISFKESLDLANMPIITFEHKQLGKLNFLIDTGSTISVLNRALVKNTFKDKTDNSFESSGGETNIYGILRTKLYLKDNEYDIDLNIADMEDVFSKIKDTTGVNLHGILGNNFLDYYDYIINYKEYIIHEG